MRIARILVEYQLARSGAEAIRLLGQGAVSVGGCDPSCDYFTCGKCVCGGWRKVTNPVEEIEPGLVVKIGNGFMRLIPRMGSGGYDALSGVCRAPHSAQKRAMRTLFSAFDYLAVGVVAAKKANRYVAGDAEACLILLEKAMDIQRLLVQAGQGGERFEPHPGNAPNSTP